MKISFLSLLLYTSLATVPSLSLAQTNAANKVLEQHQQTLRFFEIKPHLNVLSLAPRAPWYQQLLAQYLNVAGKPYAMQALKPVDGIENDAAPSLVFNNNASLPLSTDNSLDRVLAIHSVHQWMQQDVAASAFTAFYKMLKPGGVLGIVQHRNGHLKPQDKQALSGYVSEDYVIELARKAGFEFLAKTEINANSKDSKDYPAGAETLPPVLKLQAQNRQHYLAIGQSDSMTIKFIKPTKTALLDKIREAVAF